MKHLVWIIIFFSLILVIIFSEPSGFRTISQTEGLGVENIQLNNSNYIKQTFSPTKDVDINSISFMVGTYDRINRGNIKLELYETNNFNGVPEENRKLASAIRRTENLTDNGILNFRIPSVRIEKDKIYLARLSLQLEEGIGLAFWKSITDSYPHGQVYEKQSYENNLPAIQGDLVFIIYQKKTLSSALERYSGTSLMSPYIILFFLLITTLLGALIVSNYPVDFLRKTDTSKRKVKA